jgi:hypothetical protein
MTTDKPNALLIYGLLYDKPGFALTVRRMAGGEEGDWVLAVDEPDGDDFDYHVHVDEDTSFDEALEIVNHYLTAKWAMYQQRQAERPHA